MKKEKKATLKSQRENGLYTSSLILKGNGKLLDYDNPKTGEQIRYAQFNTRALNDCPFATDGCKIACYATKGNHMFPVVIESREKSFLETRKENFADMMVYTINVEKQSKRYKDSTMLIRLHESGDFYSVQYLRKWLRIWKDTENVNGLHTTFYTKSFPFFIMLTDDEKAFINHLLKTDRITMNLSTDETMTTEQKRNYLKMKAQFPLANTYRITTEPHENTNKCDCADCGKCGTCNHSKGTDTEVILHSVSTSEREEFERKAKK